MEQTQTKVGAEVRRLHIIYFLGRMGHIEHPHLIRVHHLNRNGVYLRDIKRWLADLRGKDMPDAFAWSYKRRYKSGYVWQDLLDDDLITPISDNEYVLKGSEIMATTAFDPCAYNEKETSRLNGDVIEKEQHHLQLDQHHPPEESCQIETDPKMYTPSKISIEIFKEPPVFGSERSTLTEDSMKHEEEVNTKRHSHAETTEKFDDYRSPSSCYSPSLNKKIKNKKNSSSNYNNTNSLEKNDAQDSSFSSSSSSSKSGHRKSTKSHSSNMFRNLISCGAVDTNEDVLVMFNRAKNDFNNIKPSNKPHDIVNAEMICIRENMNGSARGFSSFWNNQQCHSTRKSVDETKLTKTEFTSLKPVSAAYKPVGGPTCSQCGKSFKPEKMHTHMKSCKGMKAFAKTAAASSAAKPKYQRSVSHSDKDSTSTT